MLQRTFDLTGRSYFLERLCQSFVLAGALLLAGQGAATAQTADDFKNPERQFLDPLGVEITGQIYTRNDTFLTIGDPAAGGLAWTFHAHSLTAPGDYSGSIFDKSVSLGEATGDDCIYVRIGDDETAFNGFVNANGSSATLATISGGYVFTSDDGTVYTFANNPAYPATSTIYAYLTTIKKPNGVLITLNASGSSSSAVSNTGFALKFDSAAGQVSAVNILAHSCDAQALSCSAYDSHITLTDGVTDTNMGGTCTQAFQITDPAGKNWRYCFRVRSSYLDPATGLPAHGARALWAFKDPTSHLIALTYKFSLVGGVVPDGHLLTLTKALGDGTTPMPHMTFTYSGNYDPQFGGGNLSATDPAGATVYSSYSSSSGVLSWSKDGLNRQTNYGITQYVTATNDFTGLPSAWYTRLLSKTLPEGNYVTYTYDARGNVTSAVLTGKPGSGLSESFTASFPATCANHVTCNKPTWTKDALGNETDYIYDSTHGGVLTVTLPADQNALRRKTFNTYTLSTEGIYRLTRSETCGLTAAQLSSLTSCPSDANTLVTITDYGTSATAPYTYKSLQPYSVTQTDKSASPLVATTTYSYDVVGNVIAVDGPRTDVVDISYKTYDANRRAVCEIGVDPDGTATTLSRTMVRHTYDNAGREIKTETGYGTSTTGCVPGTDMTVSSFTRMTYDWADRLVKTEVGQP